VLVPRLPRLDSWPGSALRAGDRLALDGSREMRVVGACGFGGTAGWMEGKDIERSEAGVSSSRTAVLLAVKAELSCEERRECWW
jgi:hypothetical protein